MVNLFSTATDALAESATELTNGLSHNIPIIGNAALCTDSLCTTGCAGLNFYCSPNPISKVFFATSCVCGLIGAGLSGIALLSSVTGILVLGWVCTFGARGFNRLSKYLLYIESVTTVNITNITEIANLMS